jgi:hypothetical protein
VEACLALRGRAVQAFRAGMSMLVPRRRARRKTDQPSWRDFTRGTVHAGVQMARNGCEQGHETLRRRRGRAITEAQPSGVRGDRLRRKPLRTAGTDSDHRGGMRNPKPTLIVARTASASWLK